MTRTGRTCIECDTKIHAILEGIPEIQSLVIARAIAGMRIE